MRSVSVRAAGGARTFAALTPANPAQSYPVLDETPLTAEPPRPWLRPELVRSWREFVIVAALVMAIPIRNSTVAALHGSSSHFMQMFMADSRLDWAIFFESLLLAFFLYYLHWRGWRPADLRIGLGWFTTLEGLGLYFATFIVTSVFVFALLGVLFELQTTWRTFGDYLTSIAPHIDHDSIHLSWGVIVISMIINAFLEEIVCMGYIFNQLAVRRGPMVALIVTVLIRAACHTYQDPVHLAGIALLFTLYGVFYCWARKLWPLIFAHLVLDIVSLSALKLYYG
jgi:membrane protease YdiL (CAAX protease family)